MMQRYHVFLIVLFVLLSSVRGDRVAGSIAEFKFTRQECLDGQFKDSSKLANVGKLGRNLTTTQCLKGNGVELITNRLSNSPPIWSAPLSKLLPVLNKTKVFTVDFWVEADSTDGVMREMSLFAMSYLTPGSPCSASLRVSRPPIQYHNILRNHIHKSPSLLLASNLISTCITVI
jgi:hypothetical protein